MSIHGSSTSDQHIFFDGMNIGQNLTGTGSQSNGVTVNELAQTELVYDAGSQSAENPLGGVRMDSIPKEGGNSYSGTWRTFGSKGSLQGDNITDALRPFISVNTQLDYLYDTNAVFGGPLRKNKMWFLVAQRISRTNNLIAFPNGVLPGFPNGTQVESGGFIVPHETVRLTTQPLAELIAGLPEEQALGFLKQLDDLSVKENFLPNVGPAMLHDTAAVPHEHAAVVIRMANERLARMGVSPRLRAEQNRDGGHKFERLDHLLSNGLRGPLSPWPNRRRQRSVTWDAFRKPPSRPATPKRRWASRRRRQAA